MPNTCWCNCQIYEDAMANVCYCILHIHSVQKLELHSGHLQYFESLHIPQDCYGCTSPGIHRQQSVSTLLSACQTQRSPGPASISSFSWVVVSSSLFSSFFMLQTSTSTARHDRSGKQTKHVKRFLFSPPHPPLATGIPWTPCPPRGSTNHSF